MYNDAAGILTDKCSNGTILYIMYGYQKFMLRVQDQSSLYFIILQLIETCLIVSHLLYVYPTAIMTLAQGMDKWRVTGWRVTES